MRRRYIALVFGAVLVAAVQGQTIVDTDFASGEGYISGDLDGQLGWATIIYSNADANAFNVDVSGGGSAETLSVSRPAGGTTNSSVFFDAAIPNAAGSSISGTIQFKVSAALSGSYKTNVYEGAEGTVTNIQEVAALNNTAIFLFGTTYRTNSMLNPAESAYGDTTYPNSRDDLLIDVMTRANGELWFHVNQTDWDQNNMLVLTPEQLGWDPAWTVGSVSNAPDFETDTITLSYVLRKSTVDGGHQAFVSAEIGEEVYDGVWASTIDDGAWARPLHIYDASEVWFGMARGQLSTGLNLVDDGSAFIEIDHVSAVYDASSAVPEIAPWKLSASASGLNLEIALSWTATGEADSYNVYRSETNGVFSSVPYTNVIEQSFTDSGLTDKRTYFYTVTAVYGGQETAPSEQVSARALGVTTPMSVAGVSAGYDWKLTALAASPEVNGITFYTGNGVAANQGTLSMCKTVEANYMDPDSPEGLCCGIIQVTNSSVPFVKGSASGGVKGFKLFGGAALIWSEKTVLDATAIQIAAKMATGNVWVQPIHFAVRNGTTWYVHGDGADRYGTVEIGDINAATNWYELEVATASSTELMSIEGQSPVGSVNMDNVNGFGIFIPDTTPIAPKGIGQESWLSKCVLEYGTTLSNYESAMDDYGIYNEDAASSNDYDGDGVDNITEYGLGGDPADISDIGITNMIAGTDGVGNFVYVHPARADSVDSGQLTGDPTYSILEDSNLVAAPGFTNAADIVYSLGGVWPDEPDFVAVTNVIPTVDSEKFFKLQITE